MESPPLFDPRITPANVTANVCIVIGTPIGIGIEICAITTVTAAINAIQQISCTEIFACCILKTPFLFLLVKVYRMLLRLSTLLFRQLTFRIVP